MDCRFCWLPVSPALIAAAGLTAHPCCDPGDPLPPALEDAVTAWVTAALETGEPLAAPDPWLLADQYRAEHLAAELAALRALAAVRGPTGASVRATMPPVARQATPDPRRWPPGSHGEVANRRRY
jgi:hypothetical protein